MKKIELHEKADELGVWKLLNAERAFNGNFCIDEWRRKNARDEWKNALAFLDENRKALADTDYHPPLETGNTLDEYTNRRRGIRFFRGRPLLGLSEEE